jgi:hypothetical protein
MKKLRFLAVLAAATIGCTPSATTSTTTAPTPASSGIKLEPVSYRPEFGTMWTFDAPPVEYWTKTYGWTPDQAWLDNVRLSTLRIPGCSASFVSARGMVLTNHHCMRECIEEVSPKDTNYITEGFAAPSMADERKCEGMWADRLESIQDVTQRVSAAITSSSPDAAAEQRRTVIDQITKECSEQTKLTCQVVSLYQGGIYSLYRYRRFNDLRLAFAPEEDIAAFGGDPDNFVYPRWNLDASLLRIYENGKPYAPANYLRFSKAGPVENEVVFVTGNPGGTGRLLTLAQLEFLRDYGYPAQLRGYERGITAFRAVQNVDSTAMRRYQNNIFSLQNSQKAITGYRRGLLDSANLSQKRAFEAEFRARIAQDPKMSAEYGGIYDAIASAQRELASFNAQLRNRSFGLNPNFGGSRLLSMSGQIVRLPKESAASDKDRLAAYRGNGVTNIRAALLREQPIDTVYERIALAAQLRAAKAELGADDPFLAATLNGRTPEEAAAALVSATHVGDVTFRKSLVEGGDAAVSASADPMIVLARKIDAMNRELLARSDKLTAIITANNEKLGRALYAVYGKTLPPDATFTLRISDGVVQGYPMNGTIAPFKTTFYGLYDRWESFDRKPPFALPKRWIDRRDRLNLSVPFDFVSTNDIIGGNSGSPIINRKAEVVGVVFDGNIENVANYSIFQSTTARTVSTHSSSIIESLIKMYDAKWIAEELSSR